MWHICIFYPAWFSSQDAVGLSIPALSCCGSMLIVCYLYCQHYACHHCSVVNMDNKTHYGSCLVIDPVTDWCLCSGLCKLGSEILLNCHWCKPNVLCIPHDDLCHSHSIGPPSVAFAASFNYHAMLPGTPNPPFEQPL